jgi:hypothetical protein
LQKIEKAVAAIFKHIHFAICMVQVSRLISPDSLVATGQMLF